MATDHCYNYISSAQKDGLDYWKTLTEDVLATGQSCVSTLLFWLKPLGFKYSSGSLTLPWSYRSTSSNFWNGIELFWLDWHWYHKGHTHPEQDPCRGYTTIYLRTSTTPDQSGLRALISAYPLTNTYFTILKAMYSKLLTALMANETYLKTHISGFEVQDVIAGMMVLYEYFLAFSCANSMCTAGGWGYMQYYLPTYSYYGDTGFFWKTSSIGPYTVSVYYCENGVIRGVKSDIELTVKTIAHQSTDARMAIQDEVQKNLPSSIVLGYPVKKDLSAELVMRIPKPEYLEANIDLRGDIWIQMKAYEALRDVVPTELPADGLLADKHTYDLPAYERLVFTNVNPLDADVCVLARVDKELTAKMLLMPDTLDEVKVDMEKYHIQRFRIKANPLAYTVYNSNRNAEEGIVP